MTFIAGIFVGVLFSLLCLVAWGVWLIREPLGDSAKELEKRGKW